MGLWVEQNIVNPIASNKRNTVWIGSYTVCGHVDCPSYRKKVHHYEQATWWQGFYWRAFLVPPRTSFFWEGEGDPHYNDGRYTAFTGNERNSFELPWFMAAANTAAADVFLLNLHLDWTDIPNHKIIFKKVLVTPMWAKTVMVSIMPFSKNWCTSTQ